MTSQMIQDWVTGTKRQDGTEIIKEPKIFSADRNNSVKIKALCSLSLTAFPFSQAGWGSELVKEIKQIKYSS